MVALWHSPLCAREHFGAVEALHVLVTAGIFSAWQQQALDAKPRRLAWAIVVLAIPLGSLAADSALHPWLDKGQHARSRHWSVHRYHYLGHVPLARDAERSHARGP
jgi:hypothetical protein